MEERKLLPFEKARYNIKKFTETADLLQTLSGLLPVLETLPTIPEEEQEVILAIVEKSLVMLSETIEKGGQEWN